jgi:hypothetical protein
VIFSEFDLDEVAGATVRPPHQDSIDTSRIETFLDSIGDVPGKSLGGNFLEEPFDRNSVEKGHEACGGMVGSHCLVYSLWMIAIRRNSCEIVAHEYDSPMSTGTKSPHR